MNKKGIRSNRKSVRGGTRSRRKKRSKKRPQKKSAVSIQDYDALQEELLKKNEALPKKLSRAEIFRDNEVSKRVFDKYMYGSDFRTLEDLDSDERQLNDQLNTLQEEYRNINKDKDDHLFKWGEKYSDPKYQKFLEEDRKDDFIRSAAKFANKNRKALTEILEKEKQQRDLYVKMGLKEPEQDMWQDLDFQLNSISDRYLDNPEKFKQYLSRLYDTDYTGSRLGRVHTGKDNSKKSVGAVEIAKHYQKLPPTLYPIEEGDDESVYGKEEDLQYYHPKLTVDEMISHYKLHSEKIPRLKEDIKRTYDAIDDISDERKKVEQGMLDILKCNEVKKLAESDIHLYKDKDFKEKFITPCSDNELLTDIYIDTFYSVPINLKRWFLGYAAFKESYYRQDGELIYRKAYVSELLNDVPEKYLSKWAKEDINKYWYTMGIPHDYRSLLEYFDTRDNLVNFLNTIGEHLSSTIYLQSFKGESRMYSPSGRSRYDFPITGLSMEKIQEYLTLLEIKDLSSEQKIEYYLREDPSKVDYFYNRRNHNYSDFNEFWEDQVNKSAVNDLENRKDIVDELKQVVKENPEELNRRLHHPEFNIEKTKRYLILLFMGLVQNDWFIHKSNENMRQIVENIDRIIEHYYQREIMWSFGSFPNSSILLSSAFGPEYKAKLDEVMAFNPPWLNGQAKNDIEKQKERLKDNIYYYELYEYFENKLHPDGRYDS